MLDKNITVVVSGLPRSGTSVMMQILEAAGIEILTDRIRLSDDDNLKGYYEVEAVKKLYKDQSCLKNAQGKAVKVISELLKYLPTDQKYKIIFMNRNLNEVLASQKQMLIRKGKPTGGISDERLSELYLKHLSQLKNWLEKKSWIETLYVSHNELVNNPGKVISEINQFLGRTFDEKQMISVIDKKLYRQRY